MPAIAPELVVVAYTVEFVAVHAIQFLFGVLSRFLGGEELFSCANAFGGPLEGRECGVVPHALQIGLAVGRTRKSPGLSRRFGGSFGWRGFFRRVRRCLCSSGDGQYKRNRDGSQGKNETMPHVGLHNRIDYFGAF